MNAIISSGEEFSLLLKKWKSEDLNVGVIFSIQDTHSVNRAASIILGKIADIDEEKSTFVVSDETNSSVLVRYSACWFVYGTGADNAAIASLSAKVGRVVPSAAIEDLLIITTPSEVRISIFTLAQVSP
jgi:hypothetical protein